MNIPEKLKIDEARIIPLGVKSKRCIETSWQKSNYKWDDPKIQNHKGNLGMLCGHGIIVIDADDKEIEQIVERDLPETFTVQTGGGGKHYFLKSDIEKRIILYKNPYEKEKIHLGEIQAKGQQVVIPPSIHPNGKQYKVLKDVPIATVDSDTIKFVFRNYVKIKEITTQNEKVYKNANISITDVIDISRLKKIGGEEYQGEHPFHGSTGGTNFCVNLRKDMWHCFRDSCGGNVWSLLAMREGIISCGDSLSQEGFIKTLNIAKKEFPNLFKVKETNLITQDTDILEFKVKIKGLIYEKKIDIATENIVKRFLNENYVYTIRDDILTEMWIYNDGIYIPEARSYIREYCRDIMGKKYRDSLCKMIIDKIKTDTFIEMKDFFIIKDPYQLPVKNGVLNLRTLELTEFTPKKFFFNKINANYNPEAKCPKIIKFFGEILEENDIPLMQETIGFILVKKYILEKCFMFLGDGANGKSRVLMLLSNFLGSDNCLGISLNDLVEDQYSRSELFNKMVNLAGDIPPKVFSNTNFLKSLTGDKLSVNRKYKTRITFDNFCKMISSCNELPKTDDLTYGFFRRWELMEFKKKFIKEFEYNKLKPSERINVRIANPDIIEEISTQDELDGLLIFSIKGLHRVMKNKDFSSSKTTNEVKTNWLRKSNSFEGFFMDHLELDYDKFVLKKEVQAKYVEYCNKHKLKIENDKILKKTLETKGSWESRKTMEEENNARLRVWNGICFKNLGHPDQKGVQGVQGGLKKVF